MCCIPNLGRILSQRFLRGVALQVTLQMILSVHRHQSLKGRFLLARDGHDVRS